MVGYDDTAGGPMLDPLFYNYLALAEQSIDHENMYPLDVGGLKDGIYHLNVVGYDVCRKVMDKYQEWGAKSYLYNDMFTL